MNDDAPLVEAALNGDREAFGELVGRYQDRLFRTMVRVTGSTEDARDLVQDAFVQALVKLDSFRGASAFYTWLYRIAFKLAMSRARRRRPRSMDAVREDCGEEPVDPGRSPDAAAERTEQADTVHAALCTLADDHRRIVVLRELEGLSYEQISEILQVPVGTVRSRLFRARMQLRERLAGILGEVFSEP